MKSPDSWIQRLALKAFLLLYALVWTLLLPVLALMACTVVPKWRAGLKMRLGNLDPESFPRSKFESAQGPLWFHAVSVGEFNALYPLLKLFRGLNIVVSVTTSTAYNLAQGKLKEEIEDNQIKLIYMPWDHPWIINSVYDRIRPQALILLESEIWPALILLAHSKQIPIAIINAKVSDGSFFWYKVLAVFFKTLFAKVSLYLTQSAAYSRKLLQLGANKDRVFMTGNIKYSILPQYSLEDKARLRNKLGYSDKDFIIVCASTHPEEEATLVAIFQELKELYDNLRLVIAPRHPERFQVVQDIVNSAAKLIPVSYSKLSQSETMQEFTVDDVMVVDTIGDLHQFYALADLAFVGGTLNEKIGGHNVLEPAAYMLPVLSGPYFHKNTDMYQALIDAEALIAAETKEELRESIMSLIANQDKRTVMSANARALTQANKEIVKVVAKHLNDFIIR